MIIGIIHWSCSRCGRSTIQQAGMAIPNKCAYCQQWKIPLETDSLSLIEKKRIQRAFDKTKPGKYWKQIQHSRNKRIEEANKKLRKILLQHKQLGP